MIAPSGPKRGTTRQLLAAGVAEVVAGDDLPSMGGGVGDHALEVLAAARCLRGCGARPRRAGGSDARSARRGRRSAPRRSRSARPASRSRAARAPARGGPPTRASPARPRSGRSGRGAHGAGPLRRRRGRAAAEAARAARRRKSTRRPRSSGPARAGRRPSRRRAPGSPRRARRDRRGRRSAGSDEGAAAVLGGDQPVPLEGEVDGPDRVHVDPGEGRQLAHAGEAVAGAEGAAHDHRPELPVELGADGDVLLPVDGEVDELGALELLAGERVVRERCRA